MKFRDQIWLDMILYGQDGHELIRIRGHRNELVINLTKRTEITSRQLGDSSEYGANDITSVRAVRRAPLNWMSTGGTQFRQSDREIASVIVLAVATQNNQKQQRHIILL